MKITFILPNIEVSGGVKAVFEFANHLQNRGHNVYVIYPLLPMSSGTKWYNIRNLLSRYRGAIVRLKQAPCIKWFNLKANLIRVPTLEEKYVPDADIIVATWWATAYYVSGYGKSKGEKFYLAQHYEIWGGPEEKVNNSYKLGLRIIVNSTWLKNILQNKLGVEVEALILHSPDLDQFYWEDKKKNNDKIRILMPYRKIPWKGIEDGIKAFEIVREKYPDIQLVMYGPDSGENVPKYAEFYEKPSNDKLREIYNSCDIFVFPSHQEGFGMPPMEAMACKCAVVTTSVGAVPDYTIPGETALVSPPNSPELMAENIIKLVENEELRKGVSEAGYNHVVRNFSWDKAAEKLEQTFNKVIIERSIKTKLKESLVSVIIPCYNGEKFIQKAIESVINQTYQNWELIIVDDGSTDNSKTVIDRYLFDRRIRYILHEQNKGIPATRNTGIRASTGEYVAFLDQDDIWLPDKIERQIAIFKKSQDNLSMVCTGMNFVTEEDKIFWQFNGLKRKSQKDIIKEMFLYPINSASVMMIKRQCFTELGFFDESLFGWDDFEFWMRVANRFKIEYIKLPLTKKRVHQESTNVVSKIRLFEDAKKAIDKVCEIHPFLKKYKRRRLANLYYGYGLNFLYSNEINIGRKYLLKASEFYPLYWKIYIVYPFSFFRKYGMDLLTKIKHILHLLR